MTSLETKFVKRYFARGCANGRGALARAVDYTALRLVIFAGAFLFFRQRIIGLVWVLALALLTLLLAMVLLRMANEVKMARYQKKELQRIGKLLLAKKLVLLDEGALIRIGRPLCGAMEPAAVISAQPASPDALLPLMRLHAAIAVLAPAGYSAEAEAFAAESGLTLVPQAALLDAAAQNGLAPGEEDAYAYILSLEAKRRAQKKKLGGLPFMKGSAKKYLLSAAVLFAFSFFTRYTLYCRMLAALCMSIFSANFLIDRTRTPQAGIE